MVTILYTLLPIPQGLNQVRSSTNESLCNMSPGQLSFPKTQRQVSKRVIQPNKADIALKVWFIEDTDEIFTNYEEYLRR